MDIVYIYNGYKDSESLRYSMRSIAKHGKNVGRVFLLGDKMPMWCSDEVLPIYYASDKAYYKENDITAAIFKAIEHPLIKERFLICADDYFYIRDTDFDNYPIYLKGMLPRNTENTEKMGGWKYVRSLINTRALLLAAGLPQRNYGQHCCFYADPKLMMEFKNIFEAAFMLEFGATFDSLMANMMVDKFSIETTDRRDNKIDGAKSYEELLEKIGDTECFSTTANALNFGIRSILNQLFPNKCRYER